MNNVGSSRRNKDRFFFVTKKKMDKNENILKMNNEYKLVFFFF